jgi:hypothetical protein
LADLVFFPNCRPAADWGILAGIESELELTLQVNEHQREAAEILDLAAEAEA